MRCKAKSKRSGDQCKKDAVQGYEVCHIHGGKSLRSVDHPNYKHGLYDRYAPTKIKDKVSGFMDADPLDLTSELALARALLAQFLTQFEHMPLDAISISIFNDVINNVRRTVESITSIKNNAKLTAAEVQYLQIRAVDVALKYFPNDKQKQTAFVADLFGYDPNDGNGYPELVEGKAARAK